MTRRSKTLEDLFAAPSAPDEALGAALLAFESPPDEDVAFEEARQEVLDGNSPDAKVIEFYGDDLDELTSKIKGAADDCGEGAVLYLTVPRAFSWGAAKELEALIQQHFQKCYPLNVGTNPYLRSNDVNTRWGYVCVK